MDDFRMWGNYALYDQAFILQVHFPESVNAMYRNNGFGGVRKTDEAKRYYEHANLLARNARILTGRDMFLGLVGVDVWLWRPANRGDVDNYSKGLLDAVEGAFYKKDSQIVDLNIRKRIDRVNPRVVLVCYPVDVEVEPNRVKKSRKKRP